MFVGHYGPAAAVSNGRFKLWHAFFAVQFLDILWAPFVMLGIEKVRIVERFTASNHFDLYHMPYTHSLVMAIFWAAIAGATYGAFRRTSKAAAGMVFAALVFSHWGLDFLMHKPDLELWFGGPKVGLGLWDYRLAAVALEISLFVLGMGIYLFRTKAKGALGIVAPTLLLAAALAAQLYGNFGPPPESAQAAAIAAIGAYAIFCLLAAFVDATRQAKPASS